MDATEGLPPPIADAPPEKPTRVITLRITPSTHERLKSASYRKECSMNQWCVDRLEAALAAGDEGLT